MINIYRHINALYFYGSGRKVVWVDTIDILIKGWYILTHVLRNENVEKFNHTS